MNIDNISIIDYQDILVAVDRSTNKIIPVLPKSAVPIEVFRLLHASAQMYKQLQYLQTEFTSQVNTLVDKDDPESMGALRYVEALQKGTSITLKIAIEGFAVVEQQLNSKNRI